MMRKLLVLVCVFGVGLMAGAQNCFEIERVLVDACNGAIEGENEMVYFQVGSAALNTSNLSVDWPTASNPWLGVCQNGQTQAKTDSLNASIMACGRLLQPTGGVLPAGARVILITSTNVSTLANSFATLNDTLYVIYQCSGNTAGHFGNNSSTGTKTLTMTFAGGCTETVSYQPTLLVNVNGQTGGGSALQDGSSVAYTPNGTATYYNNGCVAPFVPSVVAAGNDTAVCAGTPIQLSGTKLAIDNVRWFSTQGTFDTATILTPVFTPQSGNASIEVILSGFNACDTIYDTLVVTLSSGVAPTLTISKDTICASDSSQICAPGGFASYQWNNGATTACFYTNQAGNYYVNVSSGSGCQATSAPVSLAVRPQPSVTIIKSGDTLSSFGAVSYQWLFNHTPISGATGAVYVATQSGLYAVQITDNNGCKATSTDVNVFVTGVNELEGGMVQLLPNPTSGWMQVNYRNTIASGTYLVLHDALGRKVWEHEIQNATESFSIGHLMRATYFWQVQQDGIIQARGKILLN